MTALGSHTTLEDFTSANLKARFGAQQVLTPRNRDVTINPGTIGVWDFASEFGAPGAVAPNYTPVSPLPDGTQMSNLVFGGAPAVTDDVYGPKTYAGGGIYMPSGGGLGASIKLANLNWKVGLMLTAWFKGSGVDNVGFNARFMQLGPIYAVPTAVAGGGAASNFEVIGPGFDIPVDAYSAFGAAIRGAMSDNILHQIAFHAQDAGNGNYNFAMYLDRVPVFVAGPYAVGSATAGFASIGARGGAGGVAGPWYRARLDDTTLSGLTADEINARDYEAHILRLRSLI